MKIEINKLPTDIKVFDHKTFSDNRGYLKCLYESSNKLDIDGFSSKISSSFTNVVRGMHWQNRNSPQVKAITVFSGSIIDFLINLDSSSSDFGSFYSFYLDAEAMKTIFIPSSYGHGFLALEPTRFFYNCFGKYSPENELSINILDLVSKDIDLDLSDLLISQKDKNAPTFSELIKTTVFD